MCPLFMLTVGSRRWIWDEDTGILGFHLSEVENAYVDKGA